MDDDLHIEPATLRDMDSVHELVTSFANRNEMLHRPLSELYENFRDYFVVKDEGRVVACGSVHVVWNDLAEIKAVGVREEYQSQGWGKRMIAQCMEAAREMGIATVFVLTHKTGYYDQLGFEEINVTSLPRKVWGECLRCPKFPNCNEIAMVYHLVPGGAGSLLVDPGETIPTIALPVWNTAGRSG